MHHKDILNHKGISGWSQGQGAIWSQMFFHSQMKKNLVYTASALSAYAVHVHIKHCLAVGTAIWPAVDLTKIYLATKHPLFLESIPPSICNLPSSGLSNHQMSCIPNVAEVYPITFSPVLPNATKDARYQSATQ